MCLDMSVQLVLVINSGSSSLKYQVIDFTNKQSILKGLIERIGSSEVPDHASALKHMLIHFENNDLHIHDIKVVGHRVVHGGTQFKDAVIVTDEIEKEIEELNPLAPLHNPANVVGIKVLRNLLPDVPQVAVFDTSFHSTIPDYASTFAIPRDVAQKFEIKKYGFHGTSHSYVSKKASELLNLPLGQSNFIICHLGNGASITAVEHGISVDTSMGLTPLEGLVMGTRSGDIDPGVIFHLTRVGGYSVEEVENLLNRESGLLGLAGEQDMREVRAKARAGHAEALKALAVYTYRIRKYVAAYIGVIPELKAVVFTAGVGENDPDLRSEVIAPLSHLGLDLDESANFAQDRTDRVISLPSSEIKVLVIGTNEEVEIAQQAVKVVATSH